MSELQMSKLQTTGLSTLLLSKYDTGVAKTNSQVQWEMANPNQVYHSLTFANEEINAKVRLLEHKRNVLRRNIILEILEKNPDPSFEKSELLKYLDFLNQKIQYDYLMAVKTTNLLKEKINEIADNK